MPEWHRVKDKDTGHIRTVPTQELPHGNYQVLKQDAVDQFGQPLPPEFAESPSVVAAEKAEGVTPAAETKGN